MAQISNSLVADVETLLQATINMRTKLEAVLNAPEMENFLGFKAELAEYHGLVMQSEHALKGKIAIILPRIRSGTSNESELQQVSEL